MKLTSALARQRAMNPMTQEGLQFRGSMGDRSTGLVRPGAETPPPGPRAQQQGPTPNALAPSPTSPRPPRPPGAPLVGARAAGPTIQANPNPAWRPQDPNAAPPPRPAAPGYQVTPQAPGAAGSSHRQVTTQGDLTGSMGWRSTSLGSPVMQATPGARAGLGNQNLGGPGVAAAGGGTLQMDMERATQLANQIAQMGYTVDQSPLAPSFSVQPLTQGGGQSAPPTGGGSGGGGGDFGQSRSALEGKSEGMTAEEIAAASAGGNYDNGGFFKRYRGADGKYVTTAKSAEELDAMGVSWQYVDSEGRQYNSDGSPVQGFGPPPGPPPGADPGQSQAIAPEAALAQAIRNSGFTDAESLARSLGVDVSTIQQMAEDGFSFEVVPDEVNGGKYTLMVRGPDGGLQPADRNSGLIANYLGGQAQQSFEDFLNQAPPEFDQAALEDMITSTRRSANMTNAQSVAAAMQMGANAGVSPEAMQGLVADAGHRQAVQVAAMEAQQRFAGEVQRYQAEMSWVQNKLAALQQQAAQSQDMRVRQMALDAQKELMAYQAQIQSEMAQAQMSAESAAKLGQVIGMIGGAIVGGVATGLSGGAAAPLLPALTAAGGAAGGYIGGRYG